MREDIIQMSKGELARLGVIKEVFNKRLKQKEAAEKIGLSTRQVRRIMVKLKQHGDIGIVHGNRGKVSTRKYSWKFRERVMRILKDKYIDFGPSFAAEKMQERESIKINRETLRQWMIDEKIWITRNMRASIKSYRWRKRKECMGEMVQTDGSTHDWLEGRGPKMVLMVYIDDATSNVFARFYPQETTHAAMDSFRRYIEIYGIPQSLYFDRNSIYKTTRQANLDEQLQGQGPRTQFDMVLDILKVEAIHAYSPQAKGRIERLFGTFQDRLIKEMRLAGIRSMEQANTFLEEYLPKYRDMFVIPPLNSKDMHRAVPEELDLNWVFAFREKRMVSNDLTVSWRNRTLLLTRASAGLKKQRVTVLENLEGEIRIWVNNRFLESQEITKDTLGQIRKKKAVQEPKTKIRTKPWRPPADHPWRKQNRAIFAELYTGT